MGCIGSRTVGGYRGGAGAGGGRARPGPVLQPPPPPRPAPLPGIPLSAPARSGLASSLSLRALAVPAFISPRSPRAPPGLASLRALCIRLPLASFRRPPPGAVPLHHTPPASSPWLSSTLPSCTLHLQALPSPAPSRPTPCPEQRPLRRTPQPQSQPRVSFARAPPPIHPPHPASIRLGCFAPISFLLRCLFLSSLPPPICFVHVHFPSGAGAG